VPGTTLAIGCFCGEAHTGTSDKAETFFRLCRNCNALAGVPLLVVCYGQLSGARIYKRSQGGQNLSVYKKLIKIRFSKTRRVARSKNSNKLPPPLFSFFCFGSLKRRLLMDRNQEPPDYDPDDEFPEDLWASGPAPQAPRGSWFGFSPIPAPRFHKRRVWLDQHN
jgi:hypothetical protein